MKVHLGPRVSHKNLNDIAYIELEVSFYLKYFPIGSRHTLLENEKYYIGLE